jgi:hypothetical protein
LAPLGELRAGVEATPKPSVATAARFFLNDELGRTLAEIKLTRQGGGAGQVEITNFAAGGAALARVTLLPSGAIELTPAAGQKLVVDADVELKKKLLVTDLATFLQTGTVI